MQDGYFVTNNCANYLSATNENGCTDYQEKLNKFKELNKTIQVDCKATGAKSKLKERPATIGAVQPAADYTVNCAP